MKPEKTKILIADDHVYLAEGVQGILEEHPNISVVGKTFKLELLEKDIEVLNPDILLLDISFGKEMSSISSIPHILKTFSDLKIIIFSQHDDQGVIRASFDAGVKSFLSKNSSPEELITAIEDVRLGNIHVSPRLAQDVALSYIPKLKDRPEKNSKVSLSERLTKNELDVFVLWAKGFTIHEVHVELSISERTVTTRQKSIKEKLAISRQFEAVKLAYESGLISYE